MDSYSKLLIMTMGFIPLIIVLYFIYTRGFALLIKRNYISESAASFAKLATAGLIVVHGLGFVSGSIIAYDIWQYNRLAQNFWGDLYKPEAKPYAQIYPFAVDLLIPKNGPLLNAHYFRACNNKHMQLVPVRLKNKPVVEVMCGGIFQEPYYQDVVLEDEKLWDMLHRGYTS